MSRSITGKEFAELPAGIPHERLPVTWTDDSQVKVGETVQRSPGEVHVHRGDMGRQFQPPTFDGEGVSYEREESRWNVEAYAPWGVAGSVHDPDTTQDV